MAAPRKLKSAELDALASGLTQMGETLGAIAQRGPLLLVFLRHLG